MNWPSKLIGSSPFVSWLNQFLDAARGCQIRPGVGYKIKSQSSSGTILEISGGTSTGVGFLGEYDPTKSYSAGQTFKISVALTIRSHAIPIGIWAVRPAAAAVDAQGFGPWSGSLPSDPAASSVDMDKLFFDPANPPTLGAAPNDKLYAELMVPLC